MKAWAAIVRWLIHPSFSEREAITVLRTALNDAVHNCEKCRGRGSRAIPGGTVQCGWCLSWRSALRATKRS